MVEKFITIKEEVIADKFFIFYAEFIKWKTKRKLFLPFAKKYRDWKGRKIVYLSTLWFRCTFFSCKVWVNIMSRVRAGGFLAKRPFFMLNHFWFNVRVAGFYIIFLSAHGSERLQILQAKAVWCHIANFSNQGDLNNAEWSGTKKVYDCNAQYCQKD